MRAKCTYVFVSRFCSGGTVNIALTLVWFLSKQARTGRYDDYRKGRRTWIWKSEEIAKILRDDAYVSVELKDIAPGDVVVYSMNGDAEHSGIVIQAGSVPIILSKWGPAHEVIHRVNDCPYDSAQTTYYRINT